VTDWQTNFVESFVLQFLTGQVNRLINCAKFWINLKKSYAEIGVKTLSSLKLKLFPIQLSGFYDIERPVA